MLRVTILLVLTRLVMASWSSGSSQRPQAQPPIHAALSVVLEDADDRAGWVSGTAIIQRNADESDVTKYVLYWGASATEKVAGAAPLGEVSPPIAVAPACSARTCTSITIAATSTIGSNGYIVSRGDRGYRNNEYAKISLYGPATIKLDFMNVESGYDYLRIMGKQNWNQGDTVTVPPGFHSDAIIWRSDASITKSGWTLTYVQPRGSYSTVTLSTPVEVPQGATHVLVFTQNEHGEMAASISASAVDHMTLAVPTLEFVDQNPGLQIASGELKVQASASDPNVERFDIYWGGDASRPLGACMGVAGYQFEGGRADCSGNGHNLNMFSAHFVPGPFSENNRALVFDGTLMATATTSPKLALSASTSMAWVYPKSVVDVSTRLVGKGSSSASQNYGLWLKEGAAGGAGGLIRCIISDAADGTQKVCPKHETRSFAPTHTWSHVACTFDGETMHVYKNHLLIDSCAFTFQPATSGDPLTIGGSPSEATWERCACEHNGNGMFPDCNLGRTCLCEGAVRYGYGDRWTTETAVGGSIQCNNGVFGDPFGGQAKECLCEKASQSAQAGMFDGHLDDVFIDNRALSLAEIRALSIHTLHKVAELPSSGAGVQLTRQLQNLDVPPGATHLLAFSVNGRSTRSAPGTVVNPDLVVPSMPPAGLAFVDRAPGVGEYEGTVFIERASAETDITRYVLYWGRSATQPIPGSAPVTEISNTPQRRKTKFGMLLEGDCQDASGLNQINGLMRLDMKEGSSSAYQDDCLERCSLFASATGCELIWSGTRAGCYVHTKPVAGANVETSQNGNCWLHCTPSCVDSDNQATCCTQSTTTEEYASVIAVNFTSAAPADATHLVVVSAYSFGQMPSGTGVPLVDYAPPATVAESVSFVDVDASFGQLGGTITIGAAANAEITKYNAYWADASGERQGDAGEIAASAVNAGFLSLSIPMRTNMPVDCTQVLVTTETARGESINTVSAAFVDFNHAGSPRELKFDDTDPGVNSFGGTATLTRASNEEGITSYDVQWGIGRAEDGDATELGSLQVLPVQAPATESIVMKMLDSYGDGWNGASYTIKDMQGTSLGTGSFQTGHSHTHTISGLRPGAELTVTVTGGNFANEVYWKIFHGSTSGSVLLQKNSGSSRVAIVNNLAFQLPGQAGSITYTASTIAFTVPAGTVAPDTATHLLAFSQVVGQAGKRYGISTELIDISPPSAVAQGVAFADTDSTLGKIGGVIEVTSAASEPKVDHYNIYWGSSVTSKLASQRLSGLLAEFFQFSQGSRVPALDGRPCAAPSCVTQTAQTISYTNTGSSWPGLTFRDNFAARWTGFLRITTAGSYDFQTCSDDGSLLFLNARRVVDNDGLHSFRCRSGSVQLSAGDHPTEARFFERGGGAGMRLEYKGPDASSSGWTIVPANVLFHGSVDVSLLGSVSASISGSVLSKTVAANTAILSVNNVAATHFIVFAASTTAGESPTGAAVALVDNVMPTTVAQSISFSDTNPVSGELGGVVTVQRAIDEADLTHYIVYWGKKSTQPTIKAESWQQIRQADGDHAVCSADSRIAVSCGGCGPNWGDLEECRSLCDGIQSCTHFTYFSDRGCRVYRACPSTYIQNYGGGSVKTYIYQKVQASTFLGSEKISGSAPIGNISQDTTEVSIPFTASLSSAPAGATHLVVISSYNGLEMGVGPDVEVVDYAPPMNNASSVSFTDVDPSLGAVGGAVTIGAAEDESDLSGYKAYWGKSANTRLEGGTKGFLAEYFYFSRSIREMPNLAGLVPDLTRAEMEVNYPNNRPGGAGATWPGLSRGDRFAGRFSGRLTVQTGGSYRFSLTSDDGSLLYIDSTRVVNNGGLHGTRTRTGDITFNPGLYSLRLDFFENSGGTSMVFNYRGADTRQANLLVPGDKVRHGDAADEPIGYAAKTGGDVVLALPSGTTIPAGGSHIIVFSTGLASPDELSVTSSSVSVVDIVVPTNRASSIEFTDMDVTMGSVSGTVTINRAQPEDAITHYHVYWGNSANAKLPPGISLGSVEPHGTENYLLFSLPSTAVQAGATHLLVYTSHGTSEMSTPTAGVFSDYFPPNNYPQSLSFTDMDADHGTVGGSVLIQAPPDESTLTGYKVYWGKSGSDKIHVGAPGLKADFFQFQQTFRLQSLTGRTPTLSRIDHEINYAATPSRWPGLSFSVEYAARWTGYIKIQNEGRYMFYLRSDDGSRLTIADVRVVDNDGLHGMRTASAMALLGTGFHSLMVEFFENRGWAGMEFSWRPPSGSKAIVPRSALFHGSLSSSLVGEVATQSGADVSVTISDGTSVPETATHLLAFSYGSTGESEISASVPIVDRATPTHSAGGIAFSDVDARGGFISGNISVTRGASEVDITHYVVYFGQSATERLNSTALAELGASTGSTVGSCGLKGSDSTPFQHSRGIDPKIVNGQVSSECEWKWQVSLRHSANRQHFCGGTLISPTWVLTAAACVPVGRDFVVVVGDYNKDSEEELEIVRNTKTVNRHPEYASPTAGNDFALIELDQEVILNDCVGFACLPDEDVPANTPCYITGWGKTGASGGMPSILQEAQVVTFSSAACNMRFPSQQVTGSMMCAQGTSTSGSVDSCEGDNGGPLVCPGAGGRYALHGAFSWGYGCGQSQYPGVYSRVWHAREWIGQLTGIRAAPSELMHELDPQALPQGATHLLVFTAFNGFEILTGVSTVLVDFVPPAGAPQSVSFTDSDATPGELQGAITIQRAVDETGISSYRIYWGTSESDKSSLIAEKSTNGENITVVLPAEFQLPDGATHILAFSVSAGGESLVPASTPVVDLDMSSAPGGLQFEDRDGTLGIVGGTVSIQRALVETSLASYNVYWGAGPECIKLDGANRIATVPIASLEAPSCDDKSCDLISITSTSHNSFTIARGFDGYDNDERANIQVQGPGTISFDRMSTEAGYDYLDLWGASVSGESLPADVIVPNGAHTVKWYSDSSISQEGWAFTLTESSYAGTVTHDLPFATALPPTATHLLVFSESDTRVEDPLCAFSTVVDYAPPSGLATLVAFTDVDARVGQVGGNVTITQARDNERIESYKLWWGSQVEGQGPVPTTMIGEISASSTQEDVTLELSFGMVIPQGMTHIIAFSSGSGGTSATGTAALLWDYAPPVSAAGGIEFNDTDPEEEVFGGTVTISVASDTTGISTYNLYWSNDTDKLGLIGSVAQPGALRPSCSGQSCGVIQIAAKAGGSWGISRGMAGYGGGEDAAITIQGPGTLSFTYFNTEVGLDVLDVMGAGYSGTDTPPTVAVPSGPHLLHWRSDYAVNGLGWSCTLEAPESTTLNFTMTMKARPALATHLVVHTAGPGGEMLTGVDTVLEDFFPPTGAAERVAFHDEDLGVRIAGGTVTIWRGALEANVLQYDVVFGQGTSCSAGTCSDVGSADVSGEDDVLEFLVPPGTLLPDGATHILVFAASAKGRSPNSTSVEIRDVNGLTFYPTKLRVGQQLAQETTSTIKLVNNDSKPITLQLDIQFESSFADASAHSSAEMSGGGSDGSSSTSSRSTRISPKADAATECEAPHKFAGKGCVLFKWKPHVPHDVRRLHERRLQDNHDGVRQLFTYPRLGDLNCVEVDGDSEEKVLQDLEQNPEVEFAELDMWVKAFGGQPMFEQAAAGKVAEVGFAPHDHNSADSEVSSADSPGGHAANIPDDPSFSRSWGMNQANDKDIDGPEAWNIHTGLGGKIIVAVIDTGVDYNHEDLRNQMWVNEGEIPDDGIDNDGNGFVDDVYGYDFFDNDGDPVDTNGHGTHCAGVIGAQANNGLGVTGVSWGPRIMALRFLGPTGGRTSGAIKALDYAVANGAHISSNSWGGGGFSRALKAAIDAAQAANHLFVAAAGNDGKDNDATASYPCSYSSDNVICVAATNSDDGLAYFSNWGSNSVDIAAPGRSIYSTYLHNGYRSLSGTSMATPFVSGAAALLWDYVPDLTMTEVHNIILTSGDNVDKLMGFISTGKRLNVHKALLAASNSKWARIQGGSSSVTIPANGQAEVVVEFGGTRLGAGEYGANLRLTMGTLKQIIPMTLSVHNQTVPPIDGAQSCNFVDSDSREGFIRGALTIVRAEDESWLTQYRLFWSDQAGAALTGESKIAALNSGSSFRDDFVSFDPAFWQPPASGNGWTFGVGYVRFAGSYEHAHLTFVRQLTPPFTIRAKVRKSSAFAGMVIQVGGSTQKLFQSNGGIQAALVGNYKVLQTPTQRSLNTRLTKTCTTRTWYEVFVTVTATHVTFADDQGCDSLTAPHTFFDHNDPQQITIGADCKGSCTGSDWDFVEITGHQAVYNMPADTLVPGSAGGFVIYAWNPVGQQSEGVSCRFSDNVGAERAATPMNVAGSSPTVGGVSVSWVRGSLNSCQFNSYSVRAQAAESTTWDDVKGCTGLFALDSTSCVSYNLTSNTPYHFKVTVLCDNVEANSFESEASLAVSTLPKPAMVPTHVKADLPTPSTILVSWRTRPLNDCEFIESRVEGRIVGGSWFQPDNCTATSWEQNSCAAGELAANASYEFQVRTMCSNAAANSDYSIPSDPMSTTGSSDRIIFE